MKAGRIPVMISKAKRDLVMQTQRHRDILAMAKSYILSNEIDMPHNILHSILPASIIPSEECELLCQPHQRQSSHAYTARCISFSHLVLVNMARLLLSKPISKSNAPLRDSLHTLPGRTTNLRDSKYPRKAFQAAEVHRCQSRTS